MLEIFFFNVGHGDSTAIHFPNDTWGVVDCKINPNQLESNVLRFLKSKNVDKLNFLCLTHPHDDHFKGIDDILKYYNTKINNIWIYGIKTSSPHETKEGSLKNFLIHLAKIKDSVNIECIKFDKKLKNATSIAGVDLRFLSPTEKVLNDINLNSYIKKSDHLFNKLSIILQLSYQEKNIILCADAEKNNLDTFTQSIKDRSILNSDVIKISHHGSSDNNPQDTLKKLIKKNNIIAIISTDGGQRYPSLPDNNLIKYLKEDLNANVILTSDIPKEDIEPILNDFGQSQVLNSAIKMCTRPPRNQYKYDGYIKVSINDKGIISQEIINQI